MKLVPVSCKHPLSAKSLLWISVLIFISQLELIARTKISHFDWLWDTTGATLEMTYSNPEHPQPQFDTPQKLCPKITLQFLESRKKTVGFDYLNMLMETSKPGLQSSILDKALNTIGRTKFRTVMVSEGAKLSNVCKKGFICAAACWYVWMKRKKKFNLQFLIQLLKEGWRLQLLLLLYNPFYWRLALC